MQVRHRVLVSAATYETGRRTPFGRVFTIDGEGQFTEEDSKALVAQQETWLKTIGSRTNKGNYKLEFRVEHFALEDSISFDDI